MRKQDIALVFGFLCLGILALWPDPPKTQVNLRVEFPVIGKGIRGNSWTVESYCPKVLYNGVELQSPLSRTFGWSSLLTEVVVWDECVVKDTAYVLPVANIKARVGWRPSNTLLPSLGIYISSPFYARVGLLGRFGMLPYFALEVFPVEKAVFIAWGESPFCKELNPCRFDLGHLASSRNALWLTIAIGAWMIIGYTLLFLLLPILMSDDSQKSWQYRMPPSRRR